MIRFVCVFFMALVALSRLGLMQSYKIEPVGDNPKNIMGTHQWIAQKAVSVLTLAGYAEEANFFSPYLEELSEGAKNADADGGYFEIFGYSVPRNSFGHFYNPEVRYCRLKLELMICY